MSDERLPRKQKPVRDIEDRELAKTEYLEMIWQEIEDPKRHGYGEVTIQIRNGKPFRFIVRRERIFE